MAAFLLVLVALAVGIALGALAARGRVLPELARLRAELAAREGGGRDSVAAVAAQALRENNESFLTLADTRLAQREQGVRDALARVDEQLRSVETSRREAYGGLLQQIEGMRTSQDGLRLQTSALVTALRAPQTRGRWGEMQLRRVIEAAGALEHCHFSEQVSVRSEDGLQRPDVVIHLSDGKQVVVDAKVPFAAWLESMEAPDEPTRQDRRAAHARALREHVKALGAKRYWEGVGDSPGFVVLFVPADGFLDTALAHDPTLLDEAFARDVVIATPSTLMALLRTIAFCWRSDQLAGGAREISALAAELHSRLGTMGGHVDKLGNALTRAVRAYNDAVGSLETRVLVTARKLSDLDVGLAPLQTPAGVSDGIRPLTAPELLGALDDAGAADELAIAEAAFPEQIQLSGAARFPNTGSAA